MSVTYTSRNCTGIASVIDISYRDNLDVVWCTIIKQFLDVIACNGIVLNWLKPEIG